MISTGLSFFKRLLFSAIYLPSLFPFFTQRAQADASRPFWASLEQDLAGYATPLKQFPFLFQISDSPPAPCITGDCPVPLRSKARSVRIMMELRFFCSFSPSSSFHFEGLLFFLFFLPFPRFRDHGNDSASSYPLTLGRGASPPISNELCFFFFYIAHHVYN